MTARALTPEDVRSGRVRITAAGAVRGGPARGGPAGPPRRARTPVLPRFVTAGTRVDGGVLVALVPVRLASELNEHEHEFTTHDRKKAQQRAVAAVLATARDARFPPPYVVTLTRIYTAAKPKCRPFDSGNFEACFKWVQDGVARWLEVDDGDVARVAWRYVQVAGDAHGLRIEIGRREG